MKRLLATVLILIVSKNLNAREPLTFADALLFKNQIHELGFAAISKDSIIQLRILGYGSVDGNFDRPFKYGPRSF